MGDYVVTGDGILYAWGNNLYGQLGLGDSGQKENVFEVHLPDTEA